MKHFSIFFAAIALLVAVGAGLNPAFAETLGYDTRSNSIQVLGLSTHQNVDYTGTAGTISNTVGRASSDFRYTTVTVRVVCTTNCYIAVGSSPTATTSDVPLAAWVAEYFHILAGTDKISAIRVTTDGTLHMTLMD